MKLIVANWKNNPTSVTEAINLAKATDYEGLIICPPLFFLEIVRDILKTAILGAQDLISEAIDLKNKGVKYVIIGHSDRRKLGETNEAVAQKMVAVLSVGLIPILCVGETLEEKNAGLKEKVLSEQINILQKSEMVQFNSPQVRNGFDKLTTSLKSEIWIAYEPVWSISTNSSGAMETPEGAMSMIDFIKKELLNLNKEINFHFLYGGSVNFGNIESFLRNKIIEGVLVGGASLKPQEIKEILNVAAKY